MPGLQAQKRLRNNWFNLVLTIISITQGFVLTFLLSLFPKTYNYSIAARNPIVLVLFILCLVFSLRVFQTYITAVLDYEFRGPTFSEIFLGFIVQSFLVFIVGSIQYYLISLFAGLPSLEELYINFNVKSFRISFYEWGTALASVAAIGYCIALRQFKWNHRRHDDDYYTEVWLQRRNITYMIVIMVIQFFLIFSSLSLFNFAQSGNWQIPFVIGMIGILLLNIRYSMRTTFEENSQMSKTATQLAIAESRKLEIEIVPAKKEDVAELCNLLMQYFGYVYKALFGSDAKEEKLVSRMLDSILKANRGNHSLGYKSFLIAHPKNDREKIVGMLMLKTNGVAERYSGVITALSIIKLVSLNLGLRGLYRVWRNWWAIRSVSQKVKANELHIVYLVVTNNARKRQVGKQLIERARLIAKEKKKNLLTLCVRANNLEAIEFFHHQKFFDAPDGKMDDKANDKLGQGPIIRMIDKS